MLVIPSSSKPTDDFVNFISRHVKPQQRLDSFCCNSLPTSFGQKMIGQAKDSTRPISKCAFPSFSMRIVVASDPANLLIMSCKLSPTSQRTSSDVRESLIHLSKAGSIAPAFPKRLLCIANCTASQASSEAFTKSSASSSRQLLPAKRLRQLTSGRLKLLPAQHESERRR